MRVFICAGTSKLVEYKNEYLELRKQILQLGHELTRDWIPLALELMETDQKLDRKSYYPDVRRALLAADVLVAEGSLPSLTLGHEITLGIELNRPVLFLINRKIREWSNKYGNNFIDGLETDLIVKSEYDSSTLEQVLAVFFDKFKSGPDVRFTMNLTSQINDYLSWISMSKKTSKSEYIRNLIDEDMKNNQEFNRDI